MGLGGFFVIKGSLEVYDTQSNKFSQPFYYPLFHFTHATGVIITLTTNYMFATNNRIDGTVDVYVNDPQNINRTFTMVLNHLISSRYETNDQNTLNDIITFERSSSSGAYGKLITLHNQPVYEANFTITAQNEDPLDILFYLQTNDGSWEYLGVLDFPTIQPVHIMTELKNSQVVEGLTWIIVGAIPIGLVAELCIIYFIERHFYQKDRTEHKFGLPND
jgi:hypothetical protein